MKPQRFAIQGAVLQKHQPEAEVILRFCGIANAVIAVGRLFTLAGDIDPNSALAHRDRVCTWIVVAAYMNEAVFILNKRHDGLAWKLADAGAAAGVTFPPDMPLATLKTLLIKGSEFIKSCNAIRDKFAFHMDREPFMEWVTSRGAMEGVGIISQLGMQNQDFVYDAATFAVHEATEKLMVNRFGELVSEVMLAIPYLVEAMVRGFATLKGLELSIEKNAEEDIVLAHEPGAFTTVRLP
jgi:hypothetical protein